MSSNDRPWYKWYPKDFETDEKVKCLSIHAEIVYRRLLDIMWQSNCIRIPNALPLLYDAAGKGMNFDEFEAAWGRLMYPGHEIFRTEEDEKWIYSQRLREQADEVKARKDAGIKAANARWHKPKSKRNANAMRTHKKRNADTDTDTDINTPLTPLFKIPDWIDKNTWRDFKEFRQKIKAPLTDKATKLLVSKLDNLRKSGNDPNRIIEQSIERGWRGVFPIKDDNRTGKDEAYPYANEL